MTVTTCMKFIQRHALDPKVQYSECEFLGLLLFNSLSSRRLNGLYRNFGRLTEISFFTSRHLGLPIEQEATSRKEFCSVQNSEHILYFEPTLSLSEWNLRRRIFSIVLERMISIIVSRAVQLLPRNIASEIWNFQGMQPRIFYMHMFLKKSKQKNS